VSLSNRYKAVFGPFCPVWPCLGVWPCFGALLLLYMCAGALSSALFHRLRVPRFRGVALSGVGRFCLFVCPSVFGCRARSRGVAGCQSVEQVFDPQLSNKFLKQVFEWLFGPVCQNFQPNPDRISNRIRTESQPNFDRISESLSLTVEPNPNRISE
jgi:hypothetical protein